MKKLTCVVLLIVLMFHATAAELNFGDKGSEVEALQTKLAELGFYTDEITGEYDISTISAVSVYQYDIGIAATGIVDEALWQMLFPEETTAEETVSEETTEGEADIIDVPSETTTAEETSVEETAVEETPVEEAPVEEASVEEAESEAVEETEVTYKKLKYADKGDEVVALQTRLGELNYYTGKLDGGYGEATKKAVKAFQKENGLKETGIADVETQAVLYSDAAIGVSGYKTLKYSATGEKVKTLQERLIELNYLGSDADGRFGDDTKAAVKLFQKENGIEETGIADVETQELLFSDEAKAWVDDGIRSLGDKDNQVKKIQTRLIDLGYLKEKANGTFGDATRRAVSNFQYVNGIPTTGIADAATQTAIFSDDAKSCVKPEHSADALKLKSKGDAVTALQEKLIDLGYLSDTADGKYGSGTEEAVINFQINNSLFADGIADTDTVEKLNSADALPATLVIGSKGSCVSQVQDALIRYGFMDAAADGYYGKNTAAAVETFQQEAGLTATAEADIATQNLLLGGTYSAYVSDIALGNDSQATLRVERRLAQLQYTDAEADTVFDEYTEKAVKLFQKNNGFEETGVVDKTTCDALFAAETPNASYPAAHSIEFGDEGIVVQAAQQKLQQCGMLSGLDDGVYGDNMVAAVEDLYAYLTENNVSSAELFADGKNLSTEAVELLQNEEFIVIEGTIDDNSEKSDVARVQRRLSSLNYLPLSQKGDGLYGKNTTSAIKAFQVANGLTETGVADEETQKVLFSASPVSNFSHYKLVVDISDQRVYVYETGEDNRWTLIDTFICSTGLDGTSTPVGVYTSTRPLDRWHYFPAFYCWAQYAYQITGAIYFHSVIYSSCSESSLRTSTLSALGHKASHGCVRLTVEDSKWIYENCEKGTLVVVQK